MSEKQIGIKINTTLTGKNTKQLKDYADQLSRIQAFSKGVDKGALKQIDNSGKSLDQNAKALEQIERNTRRAFNLDGITSYLRMAKSLVTTLGKLTNKSAEYTENINLYQVAFDGATKQADAFVNKLSEMYGLDESWLTRTTGIFKQLSNAMSLGVEEGTKLSKLMTQMSIDISSLYNIDIERASSVLQSSLAGQTKPIRGATGADITQNTLQMTLDNMGIEKAVTNLSFAEKRLLIIISLTQQLNQATNDFGKTIESPANQMRILSEQWERLSRSVGNVFLPVLAKILPYLNAVLMVLTEIINTIASFFGYDIEDYDFGVSGTADSVLELEDALNGAGESAKKLKSGLRGFDKLNVITTPKGSESGSGSGIDPEIMNAFNKAFDEYNNKLKDVRMKAVQIRDSIMEWLGFSKEIDPLTGKISWNYGGIRKTLENMWRSFKKLSPEAKILTGFFAYLGARATFNTIKKLFGLFGGTGLLKSVKGLLSPMKILGSLIKDDLAGGFTGLGKSLGQSIDLWRKNLTVVDKFKVALIGSAGLYAGFKLIESGMKNITDESTRLQGVLGVLGGTISNVFGGAMIGSLFGPWGAVIGGVSGAFVSLYEAMDAYPTKTEKFVESTNNITKSTNDYLKSLEDQKTAIEEQLTLNLTTTGIHSRMIDELNQIVEANGKVKKGYEDRATFILSELSEAYGIEYSITDGIVQNYEEYIKKIDELIAKKEAEFLLEANREAYLQAVKEEAELYDKMTTQQKNYNEAKGKQEEYERKLRETWEKYKDSYYKEYETFDEFLGVMSKSEKGYRDLIKATNDAKTSQDNATEAYKNNILTQNEYSEFKTAFMKGNLEEIEKAVENYTNTYIENGKTVTKSEEEVNERLAYNWGIRVLNAKEANDKQYKILTDTLVNETKAIEEMTPEQVDKWGQLARLSEKEFLTQFKKLPEDVQTNVVNKMQDKGYNISNELQKGINKINPKIKFQSDLSSVKSSLSSFFNNNSGIFSTIGKAMGINLPSFLHFANGGLPPVGQLFVANERGPELVGHIGGQSFVANQNQMMDLLDKKIGNGNGMNNATFIIQVGSKEVARTVLNDLQDMAKSNGKPITIQG